MVSCPQYSPLIGPEDEYYDKMSCDWRTFKEKTTFLTSSSYCHCSCTTVTYKRSLKVTEVHNSDATHLAEVGGGVDLVLVLLPVVKLDTLPACNSMDKVSS